MIRLGIALFIICQLVLMFSAAPSPSGLQYLAFAFRFAGIVLVLIGLVGALLGALT